MKKNKKIIIVAIFALLALCVLGFIFSGKCLVHKYRPATCVAAETCSKCGKTRGIPLGHVYSNATCTKPKTCSRCNATDGQALGHDMSEATCTEGEICKRCGEAGEEALGHDVSNATCTEAGVCSRCDYKEPALGHDMIKATCTTPDVCSRCDYENGEALGHNFSNGKCTRCKMNLGSLESLKTIKGLKATCESDLKSCLVNVDKSENPYDVIYDYGSEYDLFVENADWSLVFDVGYYKKTFPMLAMLYHYDDALLLKHFQTVGVHEGRQGSKDFNVGAYILNCDAKVYKAFNDSDGKNYECYYFYYMMNYDTEKNVDTVNVPAGKALRKQYIIVQTAVQKKELEMVNEYRKEVGADPLKEDSEIDAIANYRSYVDQTEGWTGHDWIISHEDVGREWMNVLGAEEYAENMVSGTHKSTGQVCAKQYYNSPEHYEAMVDKRYNYVGLGNSYIGKTKNSKGFAWYTNDVFFDTINTALNPKK